MPYKSGYQVWKLLLLVGGGGCDSKACGSGGIGNGVVSMAVLELLVVVDVISGRAHRSRDIGDGLNSRVTQVEVFGTDSQL